MSYSLLAQDADSLQSAGMEVVNSHVEHLEKLVEAGLDISELTEDLLSLLESPVNINSAERRDLKKMRLLNDIQIKNLIDYRNKYGIFYSIYELMAIDGMSRYSIEKIMPFVSVAPVKASLTQEKKFFQGRHELMFRYKRKLVQSSGYTIPSDSIQIEKPGSFYLGNPDSYYLRYRYLKNNHLSLGMTLEKDPGEVLFLPPEHLADSLKPNTGKIKGPDFISAHLELKNMGMIRSIIVGDYHIQCGQGLVLWSGLSFAGGKDPSSFKRYARVIKPNTSANENLFMRGVAGRLNVRLIDISLFYSRRKVDANIDGEFISSMPASGYHRTLNELADKHALLIQHFGGHLSHSGDWYRLGLTTHKSMLGTPLSAPKNYSELYGLQGKENFNVGFNFEFLFKRSLLYGEAGYSINGGWATLCGLTHTTNNGSIFAILYREYRKEYQNLFAQASGRRDGNANERGIKFSLECPLHRTATLALYSEHYSFPWLTSRNINVFRGQEHEISIFLKTGPNSRIQGRYRFKNSITKNTDDLSWVDEMKHRQQHQLRAVLNHTVSERVSLKCQFEHNWIREYLPETKSSGSLLLLDLYYHPENFPLKLSFRYAVFNTDNYDSRLYAYENDVLYASSMPAYYGKGFRTYLLLNYKATTWLQCWLRLSLTNYTDRNIIGSGTDEIKGNKVPEIKFQLRHKL